MWFEQTGVWMGEVNGSLRNEVLEHVAWPSSTELVALSTPPPRWGCQSFFRFSFLKQKFQLDTMRFCHVHHPGNFSQLCVYSKDNGQVLLHYSIIWTFSAKGWGYFQEKTLSRNIQHVSEVCSDSNSHLHLEKYVVRWFEYVGSKVKF